MKRFVLLLLAALLGLIITQRSEALIRPPSSLQSKQPLILWLTAANLREPLSGAQDWSLTGDALFGDVTLRGVDLSEYLWLWTPSPVFPPPLRNMPDTAKVLLRTRLGNKAELTLKELREHGGILAYAQGSARAWTRLPARKFNPRALYLAWKNPPVRTDLLGLWDVTEITVLP